MPLAKPSPPHFKTAWLKLPRHNAASLRQAYSGVWVQGTLRLPLAVFIPLAVVYATSETSRSTYLFPDKGVLL